MSSVAPSLTPPFGMYKMERNIEINFTIQLSLGMEITQLAHIYNITFFSHDGNTFLKSHMKELGVETEIHSATEEAQKNGWYFHELLPST